MRFILKFVLGGLFYFVFCSSTNAQNNYTLQKALQTARGNNTYLKSQRLNIGIAQTDTITARLYPNPFLENEQYWLTNPNNLIPGTDLLNSQNIQMLFKYMQPIPIAGQRKNQIELARKNVSVSNYSYAEFERNIFSDVAGKWLEVWTAQKQLEIIEIAKNNIDSLVLTNQNRYKNQVITQTDLYRTELLAKQYDIQLKNAAQDVTNRLYELRFLLGVEESIDIDKTDNLSFGVISQVDSLLQYSLMNRSDVQLSNSLIESSETNIKLQKSQAVPQPQIGFVYSPQNGVSYLGPSVGLNVPLFNRNQGEIKKSYLMKEQAAKQLIAVQNQIQTEIAVALANYNLQQQNLESFNVLLQQSQTILNNVKYAYLKGGTTIIDFLEAQRSWLDTQQQYYDAMQSYRQSYIQLLYATGLINQLAL